jgi:hypothetical protein
LSSFHSLLAVLARLNPVLEPLFQCRSNQLFPAEGTKVIVQLGHDTPSTMQPPSGLYMKLLFGP